MGTPCKRNISKETVLELQDSLIPQNGTLLQCRTGKVKVRALKGELTSAIFKREHHGPVFCTETGLAGDEHAYGPHGGMERAVHAYNPDHYADWRAEKPPDRDLYQLGGYGENIATTALDEGNVCIGDVFRLGDEVLLEISEPRHPCYKLNARFAWPRALKRTIQTGRVGWNMRVLKTGNVCKGDTIALVKRPWPKWSVLNVQRITRGKTVSLELLAECTQLPMTDLWVGIARDRLRNAPKPYTLVDADNITPRVRRLTFQLEGTLSLRDSAFEPYAFAQLCFGPAFNTSRTYSIVGGDMYKFTLGVALADHSTGGSQYLHQELKIGDEITMAPGANKNAIEKDQQCGDDVQRVVVVGGIGITAFLPSIHEWEAKGTPYHLHYAVRSPEEAAFLDELPARHTTLYAKSRGERLDVNNIIPAIDNTPRIKILSCGPQRMMQACQERTSRLGYPEHLVHFEDFGGAAGGELGDLFDVEVLDPDTDSGPRVLTVPSNRTLLDVLNEAGLDVMSSCKSGGCGACKVALCMGQVDYKSSCLTSKERGTALQSCVDRGIGRLRIEMV